MPSSSTPLVLIRIFKFYTPSEGKKNEVMETMEAEQEVEDED
jgi:hypothetical protein